MFRLFRSGDIFLWMTGAVLAGILFLVAGLLAVVSFNGMGVFWPSNLVQVRLANGETWLGEINAEEAIPESTGPDDLTRLQLKVGNRDVHGFDFRWVNEKDIVELAYPDGTICFERREHGNLYGFLSAIYENGAVMAAGNEALAAMEEILRNSNELQEEKYELEKYDLGRINFQIEQLRLRLQKMEFYGQADSSIIRSILDDNRKLQALFDEKVGRIHELTAGMAGLKARVRLASGAEKDIPISSILRVTMPNNMGLLEKTWHYLTKLAEFVTEDPRESNTEGGVFPAIFGTVMMVLLMTLAVVPFGVIAALYLKEYAHQGALVRLIRIAVNNLAGVPSIVFGIFGLGFFVYFCGGTIDQIFYPERLPSPTWGTGGILWASLTLALLTVPVVIVATEEALNAVPKGTRDGSLALGATKWQTTWRVILPASTPGILTGVILAMARGAGEVAPLMITGVVKLAPNLPVDSVMPFLHLDRKFMHLGFHIYDVGFQSPNVEAAKPMVFMTAFLLILIVLLLNLTAIVIRSRLRKKYQSSAF